jgi:hypothetical protein
MAGKYGKPFRKTGSGGKFRKGTLIAYKYNSRGKRVGAVKWRGKKSR